MLREVTVSKVLSLKFSSVITVISGIKWSCCLGTWLFAIWFFTRDELLRLLIVTCPNLRKNGHFGHKILFIGRLVIYRSNRYLYTYWGMICNDMIDKRSPSVNASLCEAENTWFSCKQRSRTLPKGTLCLPNYSTVTLTLAWNNVV